MQVQYDQRDDAGDPERGLALHDALGGPGGTFSRFENVQQQEVTFGTAGPGRPSTRSIGYRFLTESGDWSVSVTNNAVSLETGMYPGWAAFRTQAIHVLDAVGSVLSPVIEHRVGLRYIDRIACATGSSGAPGDWEGLLVPEILGLVSHPNLGSRVVQARNQAILDLGENYACLFNHAFVPSPENARLDYLLDFDLYIQNGRRFEVSEIASTLEVLHADALQLFHLSITPALLARFQA